MVTIEVSDDVWRHLTLKKDPGDSFDDVLRRELGLGTREREREVTPAPESDPDPYAELEFPQGVDRETAIGAIEAAVAYLRAEGAASMRELVREVMPEHDLGYEVPELAPGDRYRGSWWRKVVKPGLEAHPDVAKPKRGGSEWRWVGKSGVE